MHINELKSKLRELGIKENEYSLDGELNPDTIILYQNYDKWEVFYLDERGGRDILQIFQSEEEACNFIYKYFIRRIERKKKLGLN